MQIILEEAEIKAALVAFANSMITIREDQEIDIDMKAGRGENGYSATLNVTTKAPVVATKARATKPTVVTEAKPEVVTTSQVKSGLFNKPAVLTEAPKEEPVAKAQALTEEPVARISTGEDRGEAPEETLGDAPVEIEGEATQVEAEAPAPQPTKSIFNFQKPAANG